MGIICLLIKKKLIFWYVTSSFKRKDKRIVKKVSKAKIAITYAEALLEAAQDTKSLKKVFADVQILRNVLAVNNDFVAYMTNPLWPETDKNKVLGDVAKKMKLSADMVNFLNVLQENRRLIDLTAILDEFVHLYYKTNNIVEVEVGSAKKLSASQDKKLVTVLEKLLAKKVAVSYNVNPDLIGGLRICMGSEMFDDTVASKLNRLEIMMKGEE